MLHGTTTRHLRAGRRNNSPRLVAHRFTVGDVPLCGRSTLSDPDTIHVDDGRLTSSSSNSSKGNDDDNNNEENDVDEKDERERHHDVDT